MDSWTGKIEDPVSLQKYLYAAADPVLFVDPTGKFFSLGSISASLNIRSALSTLGRVGYSVARGGGEAGVKAVSLTSHIMGRMAVNTLKPIFRAVGRMELKQARGRSITTTDKLVRFFVSPNKSHPGVTWGPIGRWLKKAFPSANWQQHHVAIQAKWFRAGSPSQWYPTDRLANLGLQRLGNAGFNLMSIPGGLNRALGRSRVGTASLAIGSYGLVAYGVYEILNNTFLADDE